MESHATLDFPKGTLSKTIEIKKYNYRYNTLRNLRSRSHCLGINSYVGFNKSTIVTIDKKTLFSDLVKVLSKNGEMSDGWQSTANGFQMNTSGRASHSHRHKAVNSCGTGIRTMKACLS